MSDMTIQEFCGRHGACREGREWALSNCQTMDDVWAKVRPEWLIWIATRGGVLTDRELRLFAVSSARRVQHLMTDPRSVESLDVAERHANSDATEEELAAARDAAGAAAWDAAWDAAGDAAGDAAWAAARAAAWDAAWAAAGDAAWAAAGDAQAEWLRANTTPNFQAKEEGR